MRPEHAGILTISTGNRVGRYLIALMLLSSVLGTTDAWAQNLLLNPDFDDTDMLTNWSLFGGANGTQLHDSAEDVGNVAASGAVDISLNVAVGVGTQVGISQCVGGLSGNTNYNYGTRVKLPTGQAAGEVDAWIDVEFFSDGSCGGTSLGGEGQGGTIGSVNYPLSATAWYGIPGTVPGTAQTVTSPAGAGSVLVRLYLERFMGEAAATAFFDKPFFGSGVIPVELQEFVVE
jgi:hypothetical protein